MARLLVCIMVFLLALAWIFTPARPGKAPVTQIATTRAQEPPPAAKAAEDKVLIGNGSAQVVVPRAPDGHFYVDAQVGPTVIHFLIDTGATAVALSRADAQRAGIAPIAGDFIGEARTANGKVAMKPVMIDRIRIGPLEARDVEGAVIDGDLGVSLLGQSWLRRVGSVTIKDDRLILN